MNVKSDYQKGSWDLETRALQKW